VNKYFAMLKKIIQERVWEDFQRPVAMSLGFLVFTVFVYVIFLRPQIVSLRLMRAENVRTMKIFQRYRDFPLFERSINRQKSIMESLTKTISADAGAYNNTEQRIFELLNEISAKAKVRVSKTAPASLPDGRKAWDISLAADFGEINLFLFLIEKVFTVEKITISTAQPGTKHAVEMTIAVAFKSPLLEAARNDVIDRFAGKDIFYMHDEAERLVAVVEQGRKILDAFSPPPRDLLLYADTLFYASRSSQPVVAKTRPVVEAPRVNIEGIFWDPDSPVVVISGKAMQVGDIFNGIKIVNIMEKKIVIQYRGVNFTVAK